MTTAHPIDVTRGADLRTAPGTLYTPECTAFRLRLATCGIRPSKRRLAIMLYLATGVTPWGTVLHDDRDQRPLLSLCGREYIMCCGHVLRPKEAQAFVDAGLLEDGPKDWAGRPSLVITAAGRKWLNLAYCGVLADLAKKAAAAAASAA